MSWLQFLNTCFQEFSDFFLIVCVLNSIPTNFSTLLSKFDPVYLTIFRFFHLDFVKNVRVFSHYVFVTSM